MKSCSHLNWARTTNPEAVCLPPKEISDLEDWVFGLLFFSFELIVILAG
ncbi:hypothetical protein ABH908_000455 [Pseudomonas frederiksbergensis]